MTSAVGHPPELAISDFGTSTAICWDDFGSTSNSWSGCSPSVLGPVVLCDTIAELGMTPEPSYSTCGEDPRLVLNSADAVTQLFVGTGGIWTYGQAWSDAISGLGEPVSNGIFATVPLAPALDGLLIPSGETAFELTDGDVPDPPPDGGLLLNPVPYGNVYGAGSPPFVEVDPAFAPNGSFVAVGDAVSQTVGIAELNGPDFRGVIWSLNESIVSDVTVPGIVAGMPAAAAECASGFGYVAMTDGGGLAFLEQDRQGLISSGLLSLGDIQAADLTSMAAAPNGDAGLFVAVSSPAQIAVYWIACQ